MRTRVPGWARIEPDVAVALFDDAATVEALQAVPCPAGSSKNGSKALARSRVHPAAGVRHREEDIRAWDDGGRPALIRAGRSTLRVSDRRAAVAHVSRAFVMRFMSTCSSRGVG
jgi:hypothetical protein